MKSTVLALQLIAAANPDGFTIDKNTLQPITSGFAVAVEETQNSFNNEGARKVVKYARTHEEIAALGGWYNSENECFYYDAVIICDTLEEAVILGKLNKQIGIYNLNKGEYIPLK